jgi:hypothetical protein
VLKNAWTVWLILEPEISILKEIFHQELLMLMENLLSVLLVMACKMQAMAATDALAAT